MDRQWGFWIEAVYRVFHYEKGWDKTIPLSPYDWQDAFARGLHPRQALVEAGLLGALRFPRATEKAEDLAENGGAKA